METLCEQLERVFFQNGKVGGGLMPLLQAEKEYGLFVADNFHQQLVLGDSFQAFFMDTLHLAETQYRDSDRFKTLKWYPYLLMLELGNLRTVRAAEILFINGRAVQGYGLLRDLKERVFLIGAVRKQFTTLSAISGSEGNTGSRDFLTIATSIRRSRKAAEGEAMAHMIGSKSNLTQDTRTELKKWEELFHLEVHGARITSMFEDAAWIKGGELLPVLPTPNTDSLNIYTNRFSEICWMVLRTFPMLQLEPKDFGSDWADKWRILDESFRAMVENIQEQGKPVASAIIELMEAKFDVDPDSTIYPSE